MSLIHVFFCIALTVIGSVAFAEPSPLCENLAKFSCAPGTYDDGLGVVKSQSDVQDFLVGYFKKSKSSLQTRFSRALKDPQNSYFKDVAIAALGLKYSPQCQSSKPEDQEKCHNDTVEGLITIAQNHVLGPLMPKTGMERGQNLRELDYVLRNVAFTRVVSDFRNQIHDELVPKDLVKKIENDILPKVKSLLIERLNELDIPEEQRAMMISKLSSVAFKGTNCNSLLDDTNEESIAELLTPNAFYQSAEETYTQCAGYLLQSTSEFQIAMTVGHELSHSIDPCRISTGPEDLALKYKNSTDPKKLDDEYPVKNIVSCLRNPRSIGAKNITAVTQATSSKGSAKYSFCDDDQIRESFPDWLAVEVLPKYIETRLKEKNQTLTPEQFQIGYSNARRLLCKIPKKSGELRKHPAIEDRINKIILVNPKIRAQMGCPREASHAIYCDPSKPLTSKAENTPSRPSGVTQ